MRRFTERLLVWIPDEDTRSRVALATHELFENAIKFSDDGTASLRIEMKRLPVPRIKVITRNRARASDLAALSATDVMQFYMSVMRDSPNKRGGLGIARVAAETEMKLSIQFDDNLVVINAELGVDA